MKLSPAAPKWALLSAAAVAAAGAAAVLLRFDPSKTRWMPRCFFHTLTGLYCPGCGSTRAFHALLHGNVAASLRWNPLFIPLALLLAVLLVRPQLGCRRAVTYPLLAAVVLFWILRNLPWYPFTLLAPR